MSDAMQGNTDVPQFNIEEIPLATLFITTDAQKRIRLSSDIINMYELGGGRRVALGFDRESSAIAIRLSASDVDPTAANVDKRGYLSAGRFFSRTKLTPEPRRYTFVSTQDDWLIFVAEAKPEN